MFKIPYLNFVGMSSIECNRQAIPVFLCLICRAIILKIKSSTVCRACLNQMHVMRLARMSKVHLASFVRNIIMF